MRNKTGPPVTGNDFWGRDQEIEELVELIGSGCSVSIMAPRRIGKTSLMLETADRIKDRYICINLDIEDIDSPTEFVAKLGSKILPHAKLAGKAEIILSKVFSTIKETLGSIRAVGAELKLKDNMPGATWRVKGTRLMDELAKLDQPVVLFIDELPLAINRILGKDKKNPKPGGLEQVDLLLSWLCGCSKNYPEKICLVLAGSISLEPVVKLLGFAGHISTYTHFRLKPWSDPIAMGCLKALAENSPLVLPDKTAERMLELLGSNIPHHVQLFFREISGYCRENGITRVTPTEVDAVYQSGMLGARNVALNHWESRLEQVLDETQQTIAMDILTASAVDGQITHDQAMEICIDHGITPQKAVLQCHGILELLVHDGYLHPSPRGFVFESNLLREWWKGRFGGLQRKVDLGAQW